MTQTWLGDAKGWLEVASGARLTVQKGLVDLQRVAADARMYVRAGVSNFN